MTNNDPNQTRRPAEVAPIAMATTVVRQVFALLGLAMIIVAIPIALMTPFLPIGLPIAIIGVILLGRNSVWGRNWMEGVMQRHSRVERLAPNWLMKLVFGRDKKSQPPKPPKAAS